MKDQPAAFDGLAKIEEQRAALQQFLERLEEDTSILAVVQLGRFAEETIWARDSVGVWIIEIDGVTRRLRADGQAEDIHRTFVENGVRLHALLLPRTRFKQMVEGSSRTAFSCSFFEHRELVHCKDPSIERWFDEANTVATRDQEKERLMATTWVIKAHRYTQRLLEIRQDHELAQQAAMWVAHCFAALEVIDRGEVFEGDFMAHARSLNPELLKTVYDAPLAKPMDAPVLGEVVRRAGEYLESHAERNLKPLLAYLRKQKRVVPLSEITDHFHATSLYPGHLETACEWLEERGRLEKVSSPFKITRRSRSAVEEPAYFLDR